MVNDKKKTSLLKRIKGLYLDIKRAYQWRFGWDGFDQYGYTWKAAKAEEDGRYELVVKICAECRSVNVGEKSAGDEGWTICDDCRSVEQGYLYIHEDELDEIAHG